MRAACDCNAERQSETRKQKQSRERSGGLCSLRARVSEGHLEVMGVGGDSILYSLRSQCITRRKAAVTRT